MNLICLDLEGVLVPEVWLTFSEVIGLPELQMTTRDEPDYDKLMQFRLDILRKNNLKLSDIQRAILFMYPLPGAIEFITELREKSQLIILSDTFEQFAKPLMSKLSWPTLLCNTLEVDADGNITGYKLRQKNGKKEAVKALKSANMRIFAAGDSFNDLDMIREADSGCLFRAPPAIKEECKDIKCVDNYIDFMKEIDKFLAHNPL